MSFFSYCETEDANFADLLGVTLASVERVLNEQIIFTAKDGRQWNMFHDQGCCESVEIESIVGNLEDLVGAPILKAEVATSDKNPPDAKPEAIEDQDSFTWTFYKLATQKGYVDIRWYGESNGYYSESVDFYLRKVQ
jgi:hypothetical protein